jgi:hypothetical protein
MVGRQRLRVIFQSVLILTLTDTGSYRIPIAVQL